MGCVFQRAAFSALGFIIYMRDMLDDFQTLMDSSQLPNTYHKLPTTETREIIARNKICQQAGITPHPALPRVPLYTQKTLCKHIKKDIDKQIEVQDEIIQKNNQKLMGLEDKESWRESESTQSEGKEGK